MGFFILLQPGLLWYFVPFPLPAIHTPCPWGSACVGAFDSADGLLEADSCFEGPADWGLEEAAGAFDGDA